MVLCHVTIVKIWSCPYSMDTLQVEKEIQPSAGGRAASCATCSLWREIELIGRSAIVILQSMIRSFRNRGTEDVFDGRDTRAARKVCPPSLWPVARRKLDQINRVRKLRHLAVPPGNRLEVLRGDRTGQYSIRINDQYRICFFWEEGHACEIEIADYH